MAVTPVSIPGISTVGAIISWGVETTAGTKPSAFTQLQRCNEIDELTMDTESIDASALEDEITRYIKGRQDSGGDWSVTWNLTDEIETQLEAAIDGYKTAAESNLATWIQVALPNLTKAIFVTIQFPEKLPLPAIGQNELLTISVPLIVEEYKGFDTKVAPTA